MFAAVYPMPGTLWKAVQRVRDYGQNKESTSQVERKRLDPRDPIDGGDAEKGLHRRDLVSNILLKPSEID